MNASRRGSYASGPGKEPREVPRERQGFLLEDLELPVHALHAQLFQPRPAEAPRAHVRGGVLEAVLVEPDTTVKVGDPVAKIAAGASGAGAV